MSKSDAKADIWMPLYIGDYLADTGRLTTEQHGAYLLLIMDYWRNGPPPDDEEILQNITRLSKFLWKKSRPVLEKYFRVEDGVWKHKRIDEEMSEALSGKDAASEKARKAAEARWGKKDAPSIAQAHAPEMLEECPSQSSSSSPTENLKTIGETVVSGASVDDFTPKDAAEWLRHFRTKHGFEADPTNVNDRKKLWPVFAAWTNAGLSASFVDAAVAAAQARSREPISCLPLYVDRLMAGEQASRASPTLNARDESRRHAYEVLTGKTAGPQSEPAEVINGHIKLIG